jgi:hypothetical protein
MCSGRRPGQRSEAMDGERRVKQLAGCAPGGGPASEARPWMAILFGTALA